jgi:hypothetical protein
MSPEMTDRYQPLGEVKEDGSIDWWEPIPPPSGTQIFHSPQYTTLTYQDIIAITSKIYIDDYNFLVDYKIAIARAIELHITCS